MRVVLTCQHCQHQADADLQSLIATGRGDAPLVKLRWRRARYRSGKIDATHGFARDSGEPIERKKSVYPNDHPSLCGRPTPPPPTDALPPACCLRRGLLPVEPLHHGDTGFP